MPSIRILVKYKAIDARKDEVSIHITGQYTDLLQIKSKLPKEIKSARISRPFLICGGTPTLNIYCGPSCTNHGDYKRIIKDAVVGFSYSEVELYNTTKALLERMGISEPVPELEPEILPALVQKPRAKTFTKEETAKLLKLLATDVKIIISKDFILVKLFNQPVLNDRSEAEFMLLAKFIRSNMRLCGYDFTKGQIFLHDSSKKYLQTKMTFSKTGDYDKLLTMLSPEIRANISQSAMPSPQALVLVLAPTL